LDRISTFDKRVVEIGGGAVGVIYDLEAKERIIIEPLTDEYRDFFPCPYHVKAKGESMPLEDGSVDLVVITNALDHCENPAKVLSEAKRVLRAGGWLAIVNCVDLAEIHKHPGHIVNIDEFWFHNQIDSDFETVHELTYRKDGYRYGWVKYDGRVGQPAWAGLYRKVTGYKQGKGNHGS
jgi:ubiquinone/menaquinone biosynthesis C-methylase UbiE